MDSGVEPRALLLNGTVGTGKTSVALAAGKLLARAQIPHAVVDLDELGQSWPVPEDDRFNVAMTLQNLHDITANYCAAGIRRILLAGVVETRADRERFREAVGFELQVCRLRTDIDELHRRIRDRHADDQEGRHWHLERAGELDQILDRAAVDDFEILTDQLDTVDVATEVLEKAGWI